VDAPSAHNIFRADENLITGLPKLGSSRIDIKLNVPRWVARKFEISE
jgi:hypothetical protein